MPIPSDGIEPACSYTSVAAFEIRGRDFGCRPRILSLRNEIVQRTDEAVDFVRRVVVHEADAHHAALLFDS